jgi:hypothetical protein
MNLSCDKLWLDESSGALPIRLASQARWFASEVEVELTINVGDEQYSRNINILRHSF